MFSPFLEGCIPLVYGVWLQVQRSKNVKNSADRFRRNYHFMKEEDQENEDKKIVFFFSLISLRCSKSFDFHQMTSRDVDGNVLSTFRSCSSGAQLSQLWVWQKDAVENLYNEVKIYSNQSITE